MTDTNVGSSTPTKVIAAILERRESRSIVHDETGLPLSSTSTGTRL
jgi:hypothetical protein